ARPFERLGHSHGGHRGALVVHVDVAPPEHRFVLHHALVLHGRGTGRPPHPLVGLPPADPFHHALLLFPRRAGLLPGFHLLHLFRRHLGHVAGGLHGFVLVLHAGRFLLVAAVLERRQRRDGEAAGEQCRNRRLTGTTEP